MTREEYCSKIEDVISNMDFQGDCTHYERYGNGHINDTFVVYAKQEDGTEIRYILQRINHQIFQQPEQLMKNIAGVTDFIKNKILQVNGDVKRETLNVVRTKSGKDYYTDSIGAYWRAYLFIEKAASYDSVEKPEDFYQSAVAFGRFQKLLADYPAETLYETIKDFHNTPVRLKALRKAVEADSFGRVGQVTNELDFIYKQESFTHTLMDLYQEKKLPLKVTHNDTKLNNIMIDDETGKAICVIDLDTVMPGFSVTDFGDAIRFGATTAAEDEKDLDMVKFRLDLFELYTKGFLEGCNGSLSETEIAMLPVGAKMMTLECGIRFLTDYLQGDTYFRIHREGHNLDRARTQLKLVTEMEKSWDEMTAIVKKYK
ncbi:MAG: aminoglycoside phosphotransferase family protein [Mobilitalea sp.]